VCLVSIIWKVLSSRQAYVDEDRQMTAKKMHKVELVKRAKLKNVTRPEDVKSAVKKLTSKQSVKFIGTGGDTAR
jgi:hypothetical protein